MLKEEEMKQINKPIAEEDDILWWIGFMGLIFLFILGKKTEVVLWISLIYLCITYFGMCFSRGKWFRRGKQAR